LRVYFIGAGIIAGLHIHGIHALPDSSGFELHVFDLRPEAMGKLKTQFPAIHCHSDCAAMLGTEPEPTDIVAICAPPAVFSFD
jgi:predicted dehydrogenase